MHITLLYHSACKDEAVSWELLHLPVQSRARSKTFFEANARKLSVSYHSQYMDHLLPLQVHIHTTSNISVTGGNTDMIWGLSERVFLPDTGLLIF